MIVAPRGLWVGVMALGAGLGCAALQGCKPKAEVAPAAGAKQGPPQEVVVRTLKPETVPVVYEFVGQTQASKVVEIRARVRGFVLKREFEEGRLVQEGQLLYQIDPRSFEADVEVAKAQRERVKVQLANATLQLDRLLSLQQQQAATQKEIDDWRTQQQQARADLRLWEANVAIAELNLSYTNVVSPLKGKVGRTLKDVGSLVDDNTNSLMTTVWQVDPMYVLFSIPEREWLQWKSDVDAGRITLPEPQGSRVQLILLDGSTYDVFGKMDFFDATVNAQTGTATARAVFENKALPPKPDATSSEEALKPGQFVRARILGWQRPNALVVPQRAVIQTPNGPIVMLVGEGSKVEVRPIKTGVWSGDEWIVTDGLKAGDVVIVEGFAKAPPGTKVKIASEYVRPAPLKDAPAAPVKVPVEAGTHKPEPPKAGSGAGGGE
jgi:membrane fusion protein, multidrug efflux system